jgi:Flp pilus assembly CpaF family ATPase
MSVIPIRSEASSRGARMLRTALGPEIAAWLEDASVAEVMLNPDGRLWIDRLGAGIADTGSGMSGLASIKWRVFPETKGRLDEPTQKIYEGVCSRGCCAIA